MNSGLPQLPRQFRVEQKDCLPLFSKTLPPVVGKHAGRQCTGRGRHAQCGTRASYPRIPRGRRQRTE
ncbi:rCG60941 [Rattus norvegicus]|uniref:RCG60941 n=1 Tax=Rattus norvegicus TaxID=10116 RepID=A6JJV4_RAT|nr:rCG60941 [Rattus norvegicus]